MPRGFPDWRDFAPQKSLEQLLREGQGFGYSTIAVANITNHSCVQLWNPVGSGVAIYLYATEIQLGAAGICSLCVDNVVFGSASNPGINRYLGDPASKGECRIEVKAAFIGDELSHVYVGADNVERIEPCYVWLPEGFGAHTWPKEVNTENTTIFWWFEFTDW